MERRAGEIREALAFDDVLLEPAHSAVLPAEVDVRTRLTREIELGIPLISAAMDTVTEANLAIAMAQHGGLGIIHRNLDPAAQADEVRKVKKFEAGMVVNPITLGPDASLADALELMAAHRISGIPGGRGRGAPPRGHPDQSRRALCDRPERAGAPADDRREPGHGARRA